MKSMEEYIKSVYEKYEETESKNEIYETVKMKNHSPLTTLCSVTACLMLVCCVGIGYKYFKTEDEPYQYVSSEVEENGFNNYIEYLRSEHKKREITFNEASNIVIISNVTPKICEYKVYNRKSIFKYSWNI